MKKEVIFSRINDLESRIQSVVEKLSDVYTKLSLHDKEYYSRNEAAAFLDLDPDYIYQLVYQGRLKKVDNKGNKKLYFSKKSLLDFIEGKTNTASNPIEDEILSKWNKKRT